MAGYRFLNPYAKAVICAVGMVSMAYLVYPAMQSGQIAETTNIVRSLLFFAFAYLFVRSVLQITTRSTENEKRE
ncbi:hypothetical protein ACFL2Q_01645 [Thermodesulfobacteriota bacterium]